MPTAQAESLVPIRPSVGSEAYKAFLRGNHFLKQQSLDGFARATELLTEAVALEPEYALAWAHLARAYLGTASLVPDRAARETSWQRGRAAQSAPSPWSRTWPTSGACSRPAS